MIAKMKQTAVRTFRSPRIVMATLALLALTAGAALVGCEKGKMSSEVIASLVSSTAQNYTSGEVGVSSLIDTWVVVRELEEEAGKKRVRGLYIVKSRGMGHSSDVHKLVLNDDGIHLVPMSADIDTDQKKKVGTGSSEKEKMSRKSREMGVST